ncbi:MAG: sigma-70 family RNA polymerase sigma factor [Burkholderiales bacterium]|nr:sigma-70 family RNA polymerase sigma factor [Burkholderiales bacterium]
MAVSPLPLLLATPLLAIAPATASSGYHAGMVSTRLPAASTYLPPDDAAPGSMAERDRVLAALVARMARKDEGALGELYDLTVKRLHAYALRIVRDAGLAEEVTEDCLFQAWREASRFDAARGKVITWLLTICRSRALDALRRADIAELVENPDEFRAQEASLLAEPEQWLDQFETGSAVQAALALLPPKERQAVSLAFFRGMTHQEIADHWQMPLGSVKTLMHRAFNELRRHLQLPLEVQP